jgi:hypothetical protein
MRLGEIIATYDVGLALRGKSGKFEVTSPTGEVYDVICKSSHSISNLEWSSSGTDQSPFLIRRVAEVASPAETKATPTGTSDTGVSDEERRTGSLPRPFVLEHAVDEGQSSNVSSIELVYLEDDPETGQPSACVYLKSDVRDHAFEAETLITSRCATFNELDFEIRRLQAQLDEIRSRAKKMFYKAQAVAASA